MKTVNRGEEIACESYNMLELRQPTTQLPSHFHTRTHLILKRNKSEVGIFIDDCNLLLLYTNLQVPTLLVSNSQSSDCSLLLRSTSTIVYMVAMPRMPTRIHPDLLFHAMLQLTMPTVIGVNGDLKRFYLRTWCYLSNECCKGTLNLVDCGSTRYPRS